MSLSKSEIKIAVLNDVGAKFEDQLEGVRAEKFRYQGAQAALKQAAGKVQELHAHIDKDMDEGKLPRDLALVASIKRYVTKAVDWIGHLGDVAKTNELVIEGRLVQAQSMVEYLKKIQDAEKARVQALLKAIEAGKVQVDGQPVEGDNVLPLRGGARPTGAHPGKGSLAERREAARLQREAEQEAAEPVEEPAGDRQVPLPAEDVSEPVKPLDAPMNEELEEVEDEAEEPRDNVVEPDASAAWVNVDELEEDELVPPQEVVVNPDPSRRRRKKRKKVRS